MRPLSRALILLSLVALCAACSRTGPAARPPAALQPSPAPSADLAVAEVVRVFAECLSEEGVRVSGPSFVESGALDRWPDYPLDRAALRAERACGKGLAEIAFAPTEEEMRFRDRARSFVRCMRRAGIVEIEVTSRGIELGPGNHAREIRRAERKCVPFLEGP